MQSSWLWEDVREKVTVSSMGAVVLMPNSVFGRVNAKKNKKTLID